jgi:hypothetical protein
MPSSLLNLTHDYATLGKSLLANKRRIQCAARRAPMTDGALQPNTDNLALPEVGAWTEDKHRLVSLYAALFSKGMKKKWGKRVYVELYAGAGYSRIRGTQRIILGSPLRALAAEQSFDKYVFCEAIPANLEALKARVNLHFPAANVAYVEGRL